MTAQLALTLDRPIIRADCGLGAVLFDVTLRDRRILGAAIHGGGGAIRDRRSRPTPLARVERALARGEPLRVYVVHRASHDEVVDVPAADVLAVTLAEDRP